MELTVRDIRNLENIILEECKNYMGVANDEQSFLEFLSERKKKSTAATSTTSGNRSQFMTIAKNRNVNNAPVAEFMFPKLSADAARSLFSKKVRGAKSDSGSTYRFTNKEIEKGMGFYQKYFSDEISS